VAEVVVSVVATDIRTERRLLPRGATRGRGVTRAALPPSTRTPAAAGAVAATRRPIVADS